MRIKYTNPKPQTSPCSPAPHPPVEDDPLGLRNTLLPNANDALLAIPSRGFPFVLTPNAACSALSGSADLLPAVIERSADLLVMSSTDPARLLGMGGTTEDVRRRVDTPSALAMVVEVEGREEPQGGRVELFEFEETEEGVGERRGVGVVLREEAVEMESREGGRTGIPVRPMEPGPPMDIRRPEREGGRVEVVEVKSAWPLGMCEMVLWRWGLARGMELPAITRFRRLSSRCVSCLTRSVIFKCMKSELETGARGRERTDLLHVLDHSVRASLAHRFRSDGSLHRRRGRGHGRDVGSLH